MIDECASEKKQLSSIAEALARISSAIEPVTETERVELKHGLGRVLAEPVYSAINSPFERNSAMDGYALKCNRTDKKLNVLKTILCYSILLKI